MAFPSLVRSEGLEPHVVGRLYLFWSERPSLTVVIGDALDAKRRALAIHASQRQHEKLNQHKRRAGGEAEREQPTKQGDPALVGR